MDRDTLRSKFRGAMLGAGVGDSLGAPFEGRLPREISELRHFVEESLNRLTYTDDMHMTIGMAQSLVERGEFDGEHMAVTFAENFEREPWRGYGPGPPRVFEMLRQGVPWHEAARRLFGGQGSFGNGAAMRVTPAALFGFPDPDKVEWLARETALITHAHPQGQDGAAIQAAATTWLLATEPGREIDREDYRITLRTRAQTDVFRNGIDRAFELARTADPIDIQGELGTGIEAVRSVPTALCCFLVEGQSFQNAVLLAISLGGDTDTIACMTGALSGAYLGEEAIPDRWKHSLEDADELRDLADALLDLRS